MKPVTSSSNHHLSNSDAEAIADRLSTEIRSQENLHACLLRDLAQLASSPSVSEDDFHATFLKALGRSGLETRLQNAVFHLLRNKKLEEWVVNAARTRRKEPLAYMVKVQVIKS